MAREAKRVSREWEEYVPNIGDNRDDKEPFTVEINPATGAEYSNELAAQLNFTGREDKKKRAEKHENAMREMFRKRVRSPKGYSLFNKDTGERIVPVTSVELFDAILEHGDGEEQGVLTDIFAAIGEQSKLREGLRETLRSRSEPTS